MGYIGAGISRFNTADKLTVTGDAEFNGSVNLGDNDKAIFGAGSDLQVYHNGNDSVVRDAGTGDLLLAGSTNVKITTSGFGETMAEFATNGAATLYHNNLPKFATTASGIDVTGSVVVGDSHTIGDDANDNLTLTSSTGENIKFDTAGGTTLFFESGSEVARISSGNVGIGVSTASGKLHLSESGAVNQAATIFSLDGLHSTFGANLAKSSGTYTTPALSLSGGGWEYQPVNSLNNHGAMIYLSAPDTNSSAATPLERLRIDGNGSVLVGAMAEADWETVAGFRTRQSGSTTITRSAAPVLYANRLTSDGDLVEFRKDGTTVGSIGTTSLRPTFVSDGGLTYDAGFRLYGSNTSGSQAIEPYDGSGSTSGLLDLGRSSSRFKDLYLSGGVYINGTANANRLDDYEEGTWIPSFNLVTRTHTAQYGRYVKIGKMVHLKGYISVSSIDNTDPSGIQMTVPISANSANSNGSRGCTFAHDAASSTLLDGSHASVQGAYVSGTTFAITNTGGGNFAYNQLTQSSGVFIFALTYEAA